MSEAGCKADSLAHLSECLLIAKKRHSLVSKSGPLKGRNRPKIAVHDRWHERRLLDRKAAIQWPRAVRQLIVTSGHSGGGGRHPKTSVRRDTSSDRRAAASPFAAMRGLGRDTSRSPDRTGVCRAGVGTLSAHEMTTGRVSHQRISPIKGQTVIYRPSIGPVSLRDALRGTFVGNHRESSGESRLNVRAQTN